MYSWSLTKEVSKLKFRTIRVGSWGQSGTKYQGRRRNHCTVQTSSNQTVFILTLQFWLKKLTHPNHTVQLYLKFDGGLGVKKLFPIYILINKIKNIVFSSNCLSAWNLKTQYLDNNVSHKRFGGWRRASLAWNSLKVGYQVNFGWNHKGRRYKLRLWCFSLSVLYEEIFLGTTFFILSLL